MISLCPEPLHRQLVRKRLSKRKAVTIGVGFKCSNGIVLAADTQMTWKDSHKYYECKLYPHRQHEWTVVFTFAGDPSLMKSFNDKFGDAMKLCPAPHAVGKIKDTIETVLQFFDVLRDQPTDLNLLCAVSVPSVGHALFKTQGHIIHEVHSYDYVGFGDSSVLRYLGPLLADLHVSVVPSVDRFQYIQRQAVVIATYLVLKAKTHVDGCGGDTDVWVVRPSGMWEPKTLGEIQRIEQMMLKIEHYVKRAAALFFDKRFSDQDFETVLQQLDSLLKDEHFELRVPADN